MISEDKLYYILKFFEEKKIQQTKICLLRVQCYQRKDFSLIFFLQQSEITGENPWKGEKFLKATALYRKY